MFHLALASEWKAGWRDGLYTPARFSADGFVHCCDDGQTTLKVAAAYFSRATEEVLVVELDEALLGAEVKREAPVSVDGAVHAHHDGRKFPHVYGPIVAAAVVRVVSLQSFMSA